MPAKTFKDYLADGMFENFIRSGITLHKFMNEHGVNVTIRSAQRYIKGDYIPKFTTARKMMDAMNVQVSDEELLEAIKNSEATFRKKTKIKEQVSIKVKNLSDVLTDEEEIMKAFEERFHKAQGNKRPHFSSYVEKLIKADIDRHILDD